MNKYVYSWKFRQRLLGFQNGVAPGVTTEVAGRRFAGGQMLINNYYKLTFRVCRCLLHVASRLLQQMKCKDSRNRRCVSVGVLFLSRILEQTKYQ